MHGLYKIKVVDGSSMNLVIEYHACTHPAKGDSLAMPDGTVYRVESVVHLMQNDNNGAKRYISFSHVLLTVF